MPPHSVNFHISWVLPLLNLLIPSSHILFKCSCYFNLCLLLPARTRPRGSEWETQGGHTSFRVVYVLRKERKHLIWRSSTSKTPPRHSKAERVQVAASFLSRSRTKTMEIVIALQIPSAYLRECENEWQSKGSGGLAKGEWQRRDCNCYLRERWWVSFGRWGWCKMLLNHFPLETSAKIFNFLFKFLFPPPSSSHCALTPLVYLIPWNNINLIPSCNGRGV